MTSFPKAGLYQYSYPTFIDKPQWLYVHALSPDQQKAFVSYPFYPYKKEAQVVPISWFETVTMVPVVGYSPLMHFLAVTLPGLVSSDSPEKVSQPVLFGQFAEYEMDRLVAA
jgi:hypothetical protein